MNLIDKTIQAISPRWAYQRQQYRRALAAYEAATPSRLRKLGADNSSGDALTGKAGSGLRGYARSLEQNYDVAKGALDVLVNNIIGPYGIHREPQPRTRDGDIHEDLAKQLNALWGDWSLMPEVTHELDYAALERLLCRSLLRDGEILSQTLMGRIAHLNHGTLVPLSIEVIEADYLPIDLNDSARGITQGVERNAWGQALAYHLYKSHPGDRYSIAASTKRVGADSILHMKLTQRARQARGVTLFASVLRRLEDLKDYEESERVAARVAAAMTGYIKKGAADEYAPPDEESDRTLSMKPGMIFDGLLPGEDVGTIESNRPSSLLEPFHQQMIRSAAGGLGSSYSSLSKNYNGTYSAQRQELVEGWSAYQAMTALFVSQFSRPVWRKFIDMAMTGGLLDIPSDLDPMTLYAADFRGPAMPWIDPVKEADANKQLERSGYKSAQQIIRERGGQPMDTLAQIQRWRESAHERGLMFDTDIAHEQQSTATPSTMTGETDAE